MFNQYPYNNLEDLNLDYLLARMRNLEQIVKNFVALESVTFSDPIQWSIASQYAKNVVVLDENGNAFISKKAVPVGVGLDNEDYWLEIFNFMDYVKSFNANLTFNIEANTDRASVAYSVDDWLLLDDVLYKVTAAIAQDELFVVGTNIVHFTVEDFIKAWINYANGLIVQYKNDIDASELAYRNQLAQDIANTTNSLEAQLNAAIAGVTVDSEVINARVGLHQTFATLGDAIRTQISGLVKDVNNGVHNHISGYSFAGNYAGVTYTFDGVDTFEFNGTATADINFNLFADTSQFFDALLAGVPYYYMIDGNPAGLHLQLYQYLSGAWSGGANLNNSLYYASNSAATGQIIRFKIDNGTVLNNTKVKFGIFDIVENEPLKPTTLSQKDAIDYCLSTFGYCILGEGKHPIDSAITMPDNTTIKGFGQNCILDVWLGTDGLILGNYCSVEDIAIVGYYTFTPGTPGTYSGIKIIGNYNTAPYKRNIKLSNVRVSKFDYCGLLSEATGYWCANSISATNCEFDNCYFGILCHDYSEFGRFTNCLCHTNYIGLRNNSGNNKYVNCTFTDNYINVQINGGGADGSNSGHGSLVGCDMNHANNNSGFSLVIQDTPNGFVIDGCNIWYGMVLIENAQGVIISDCIFGGGTPEIRNYSSAVTGLYNNMFKATPTIDNYATLKSANNYLMDGTPV